MITLRADNRALMDMQEAFSYLADNYTSNVSAIVVTNASGFAADDPVLISHFGSETAEVVYILSVNTDTNTLTLQSNTKFAHSESTRVSKLRYSMVEFIWGDGPDYSALASPISQDIPSLLGDSSTEWVIAHNHVGDPANSTRYTWSETGTDPRVSDYFSFPLPSAGSFTQRAWVYSPNFTSNNNVTTLAGGEIYAVGEDYFVISGKAAGTDETKLAGTGYIKLESTYIDVAADNFYTIFRDNVLTTGFGFFRWWNPRAHIGTLVDSPIPYAGFPDNCAKVILDDFFSTLNNKELKLITRTDAFRWLSEGYSVALNELNLVNKEFGVTDTLSVTTASGTQEYPLPRNFSRIISVWEAENGREIGMVSQDNVSSIQNAGGDASYYLRGVRDLEVSDINAGPNADTYLGFTPSPTGVGTYLVKYLVKGVRLVKNYDAVYLPNNEFYCLKDYMMFRAAPKLNRGDGSDYFQLFNASIQRMKITSHKQDNRRDTFGIETWANV